MMETHFITDTDLVTFFTSLEKRGPVYMAVRDEQGTVRVKPSSEVGTYSYPGVRAFQPLKPFFFSALEEVAEYPSADKPLKEARPFTIVGAASCDLRAIEALDHVFLEGDFKDPFYEEK